MLDTPTGTNNLYLYFTYHLHLYFTYNLYLYFTFNLHLYFTYNSHFYCTLILYSSLHYNYIYILHYILHTHSDAQ